MGMGFFEETHSYGPAAHKNAPSRGLGRDARLTQYSSQSFINLWYKKRKGFPNRSRSLKSLEHHSNSHPTTPSKPATYTGASE